MPLTSACGPHCLVRANAEDTIILEAHCPCDELCHQGSPPPGYALNRNTADAAPAPAGLDGQPLRGVPMCTRWYERAGDYRPWQPPHLVIRDEPARHSTPVPAVDEWAAREGGVH
jgi:hypothetical protein